MKSLYLIAGALAVVMNSELQRTDSDVVWYPVNDEEGVFISTLGEKHRAAEGFKWRSNRRARYSGEGFHLVPEHDLAENKDSTVFHDVNNRKHYNSIPKVPLASQDQQFFYGQQDARPQLQVNHNYPGNSFQEIINEVFSYKHPSAMKFTDTEWNSQPANDQNRWKSGNHQPSESFWEEGGTSFPDGKHPGQRPVIETSGSLMRPEGVEWVIKSSSTSVKKPNSSSPGAESDRLVFPGEWAGTQLPTEPPTPSSCERTCPVTPEFNPLCGSDGVTYTNAGKLKCAQMCGKNVRLSHHGNCGRTPLVTPLISENLRRKFKGIF